MNTNPQVLAERRDSFFANSALIMLACVILSFPLTYYWPVMSGRRTFAPLVHLHGAVFFAWMFLYVWQTRLVATGRTALHREIGLSGIALSTLLVTLGIAAAIHAAQGRSRHGDPLPFAVTFFNLMDMVLFTTFMTASIAAVIRHREWHRRLTYAAAVCLLAPAMARWTVPYLSIPPFSIVAPYIPDYVFLGALAVHDRRTLGGIHPATLVAAVIMVPVRVVSPWIAFGHTWNAVAPRIMGEFWG